MRKFIKNILVFIVLVLIAYPFCIWSWGTFVPSKFQKNLLTQHGSFDFSDKRFKEAKSFGNVDVLILGSSHSFTQIDPRAFGEKGFKAFNLGSSAQTPVQTEALLKRYFDKLSPKYVVFEIFPKMFAVDGIESSLDIVRNDSVGLDYLSMALSSFNMKLINTTVFHYINGASDLNISDKYKIDNKYISGGFVKTESKNGPLSEHKVVTWDYKSSNFEAFQRIVTFLKQKNVPLLCIEAPCSKALYQKVSNREIFKKDVDISHLNHINFNSKSEFIDSIHFRDFDHLNLSGVYLFNQILIPKFIDWKKRLPL